MLDVERFEQVDVRWEADSVRARLAGTGPGTDVERGREGRFWPGEEGGGLGLDLRSRDMSSLAVEMAKVKEGVCSMCATGLVRWFEICSLGRRYRDTPGGRWQVGGNATDLVKLDWRRRLTNTER